MPGVAGCERERAKRLTAAHLDDDVEVGGGDGGDSSSVSDRAGSVLSSGSRETAVERSESESEWSGEAVGTAATAGSLHPAGICSVTDLVRRWPWLRRRRELLPLCRRFWSPGGGSKRVHDSECRGPRLRERALLPRSCESYMVLW